MAVRKLRRSWWVDFRWRGSRFRKRSPLNSADGAREYEVRLRRALMEHGTVDVEPTTRQQLTLREFAEWWMRDYVAVNNGVWERYKKRRILDRDILPLLGARRLRDISAHDVESLKSKVLSRGAGPKTANNVLTILRRCLATAGEWGVIERVPLVRLLKVPPPEYRFLTQDELEQVLAQCDAELRLLVLVAARTGLRWSELEALQWQDVDLTAQVLTVRRAHALRTVKSPKNGRVRNLPLTSDVVAALASRARTAKFVFHRDGRPLAYTTELKHLAAAARRAGVPRVTWHPLRHTFASHLSGAGAPIRAIQELLGHSSLTMTMRYAHTSDAGLRAAVSLLEPVNMRSTSDSPPPPEQQNTARLSGALLERVGGVEPPEKRITGSPRSVRAAEDAEISKPPTSLADPN